MNTRFKFFKILAICIFFSANLFAFAQTTEKPQVSTPKYCSKFSNNLPSNTSFIANSDGSMTVKVPDDWFLMVNQNGRWERNQIAKVTCTCNSGTGGCSPAASDGTVGCVMTSCSNCSKSNGLTFIAIQKKYDGIAFASQAEVDTLPSANSVLVSIPEVQTEMLKLQNVLGIKAGAKADKVAMVRIFGYLAALNLPDNARLPSNGTAVENLAAAFAASNMVIKAAVSTSCSCETSGKCPLVNKWVYKYCDATNCQSCSMSNP